MSDVTSDIAVTVTSTAESSMMVPACRNLFRFMDGPRLGAQWKSGENDPIDMISMSEPDFDLFDITVMGTPAYYCVLAPGLGVMWPTPHEAGVVTVFVGSEA